MPGQAGLEAFGVVELVERLVEPLVEPLDVVSLEVDVLSDLLSDVLLSDGDDPSPALPVSDPESDDPEVDLSAADFSVERPLATDPWSFL